MFDSAHPSPVVKVYMFTFTSPIGMLPLWHGIFARVIFQHVFPTPLPRRHLRIKQLYSRAPFYFCFLAWALCRRGVCP